MPQELAGRPGEKGLQSYQFDCLKCLVRTVAHRSRICPFAPFTRAF